MSVTSSSKWQFSQPGQVTKVPVVSLRAPLLNVDRYLEKGKFNCELAETTHNSYYCPWHAPSNLQQEKCVQ